MFLNPYGISKSRFQRLLDYDENHGISLRIHSNNKSLPHNALTIAIDEDVKNFLSNFVDENAALLPGRIPGFKNEDIQLLSLNETKVHLWKCFTRACEESNKQPVCYTKFTDFWKQFFPNVVMAKPDWLVFHVPTKYFEAGLSCQSSRRRKISMCRSATIFKFSADRENFIERFVKRQNAVLRNWKTK